MRVVIAAPEHEDGQLLADELHDWLVGDTELHRTAEIRRPSVPRPGTMGPAAVIEIVVSQGIAALNLAIAYASWRSTRPSPPGLTVTLPGGATLTVRDDSPEALERILAALRENTNGVPRAPAPPDDEGETVRGDEAGARGDGTA
ncbi:hypothetical protein [Streptomyces sp. NBC_00140]|uniref:effector-associated constant component EACC1 n=1 Tax=Streptomyces sp. NBC_00140 TaxID=2975664 RepID=UPI0022576A61|nr:hypothetical protein [Streptomyces sp. NBC_00140]MCX5330093.1 hypothetical protein [Streptomyces sp. NBC_00140]